MRPTFRDLLEAVHRDHVNLCSERSVGQRMICSELSGRVPNDGGASAPAGRRRVRLQDADEVAARRRFTRDVTDKDT